MRTTRSMNGGDIETNTNYHPEALGSAEFQAGEPEQVWDDYALELVPLLINDQDTDNRVIMRNGKPLNIVSDQYRLLPNEKMQEAADSVAERVGAVPFDEFGGDWYIEMDDHVFQDEEGRRAHALYAWDDPFDVGGGDEVQFGFAVHNSIDASMGFNVGLFTFRHACANMVFMGLKGDGMSFDDREVLNHTERKHTLGLDVDNLEALIESTVAYIPDVREGYEQFKSTPLDTDTVLDLLARVQRGQISKKDVPPWMEAALDTMEEAEQKAEVNEDLEGQRVEPGLSPQLRAGIVGAEIPEGTTAWDAYNDITANVWHDDSANDQTRIRKFKNLHRSMPVASADGVVIR